MKIFKLEEFLAQHEFSAQYLLCCSDAETFSMQDLLKMASSQDMELWEKLTLGYTETAGLPLLKHTIAQQLYPALNKDQIHCFAGAEDAIFCALHTLCHPGNHIIVLTPCYQSLQEIPLHRGAHVTDIALREENQWRIDIREIKHTITPKTKGIIINFPHNPTGQIISQDEIQELVALCTAHDLWLFSDEVYRLLGNPDTPWSSPAAELYPKAISLGVMSKSFGLAGLRIGWLACQDKKLLQKIARTKDYTSISNSAPSEILALIALRNKDQILARNNQIVAHNLTLIDQMMETHGNCLRWVRPQGGCVGFINYLGQESVDVFSKRLLQQTNTLIMPASIYDCKTNHFRIGFGRRNMPDALKNFKSILQ